MPTRSGRGRHPWTLYSLCATQDGLERASKAHKDLVRSWLVDPPSPPVAICIADSGQRHLAYRTPANHTRDVLTVRFDERLVDVEPEAFGRLVEDVELLLAQGLSKRDITSGSVSVARYARLDAAGRAAWVRIRSPAYGCRTAWLMADSTIKAVRALRDTTNQYLWQPALALGEPATLLGKPVLHDPDMPAMATRKWDAAELELAVWVATPPGKEDA